MDFHLQNTECLTREANTTLSFLFVVVAASFTGALKVLDSSTVWGISLFALCCYLAVLAAVLARGCLSAEDIQPPANEPNNLRLSNGFTSEQIREAELGNLQKRIDFNQARNARIGRRLNAIRKWICAAPLVFLLAALTFKLIALSALGHPF